MDNKTKLKKSSEIQFNISELQLQFLIDKIKKISYLKSILDNQDIGIDKNIINFTLLEREGFDSSLIEGRKQIMMRCILISQMELEINVHEK